MLKGAVGRIGRRAGAVLGEYKTAALTAWDGLDALPWAVADRYVVLQRSVIRCEPAPTFKVTWSEGWRQRCCAHLRFELRCTARTENSAAGGLGAQGGLGDGEPAGRRARGWRGDCSDRLSTRRRAWARW